ncbi:hypothetical protein J3Q64DRAFT_1614037, partial [Phycomyces blakesleeanus]
KEPLTMKSTTKKTTVDVLLSVCNNNRDQFKRILDALEKDGDVKRARLYADNGLLYSQPSSSTMPEPLAL